MVYNEYIYQSSNYGSYWTDMTTSQHTLSPTITPSNFPSFYPSSVPTFDKSVFFNTINISATDSSFKLNTTLFSYVQPSGTLYCSAMKNGSTELTSSFLKSYGQSYTFLNFESSLRARINSLLPSTLYTI